MNIYKDLPKELKTIVCEYGQDKSQHETLMSEMRCVWPYAKVSQTRIDSSFFDDLKSNISCWKCFCGFEIGT